MEPAITSSITPSVPFALTADTTPLERAGVLFLAVERNVRSLIDPSREARAIEHRLATSPRGRRLAFVTTRAAQVDDVLDLVLRHRPRVVHIAGHCTRDGALVLADSSSMLSLLETFRLLHGKIQCVFINAGHTAELARAIAEHVDCAIGVQGTWSPRAGHLMSEYFYAGVGQGYSVRQAFDVGRLSLSLHDCDEHEAARLFTRHDVTADRIVLAPQARRPSRSTKPL